MVGCGFDYSGRTLCFFRLFRMDICCIYGNILETHGNLMTFDEYEGVISPREWQAVRLRPCPAGEHRINYTGSVNQIQYKQSLVGVIRYLFFQVFK